VSLQNSPRGKLRESLSRIPDVADVRLIASETLKKQAPVTVAGLGSVSAKSLFLAALWQGFRRPVVLVTANDTSIESLSADIGYFHGELNERPVDRVSSFPAWDVDPYSGLSPHADIGQARARTLWRLRSGETDIVVTSVRALGTRLPRPASFDAYGLHITLGDEVSQELMLDHLSTAGYLAQEPVVSVGEYSKRGGIVDVFSPLMPNPVRIEFFGDTVESIREFDPDDQRSTNPLRRIEILPMQEQFVTREMFRDWAAKARRRWEDERYHDDLNEKLVFADDGEPFPGSQFLIPVAQPLEAKLVDYLDEAVFVLDEPELLNEGYAEFFDTLQRRYEQTESVGGLALSPEQSFLSQDELRGSLQQFPGLKLEELGESGSNFIVVGQPARKFHGRMRDLVEAIRDSFEAGRQVLLMGSTLGMAERLRDILHEYELPIRTEFGVAPLKAPADGNAPVVAVGRISGGFRLPDVNLEVFAETDVLDETEHFTPSGRSKSKTSAFLSGLQDLKPGNYVVHVDHGVGRYGGLETVHGQECMVLTYQDEARLYVPLERLDLVQRYSATDGSHPKLDRLGGTSWINRKTRVRKAIRDMAQELLDLYAQRKVALGHAFPPDTEWQKEFEDAFQYEETPDQQTAIQDIKSDMELQIPMDRLVCGDVGYGKTEVAMRAIFKAVADGKQVAVLAPTTILAFQHYETFKERFAAFPMTIAMLSRFVGTKEQKQVVSETGFGKVDVLIGTHRILSKDVHFQDLGLLIVDEEQRFGVAHKERLKQLKKQVDVLTMTATPIPRTLHMALTGLRDMSVIETPPRDRLAINTNVLKFNSQVIENAINFEVDRGGQVYLVHNRVESIYSMADFVRRICPRARIGVGHGQMGEKELERVMLQFMHGEFDVLVATTIIENGLDIPLANTLIVNRADRYGLAQLYQLRGRVGRSNRRAYAYLLIPSDKVLTPIARRRLAAIREFSELGAGFRIAALDLELRGAGNLLGGQQHGHIEAIGFDLYCQMLERAMEELRTGEVGPEVETTIRLGADLKIPESFVSDEMFRLRVYKSIASARTEEAIDLQYQDLEDRFGALPPAVENLLEYARLRLEGRSLSVHTIERKRDVIDIVFDQKAHIDPERIVQLVEGSLDVVFAPPATLRIKTPGPGGSVFESIQSVLAELS
jgi:transcription-repair coupling factor (superfamily II helicase)